MVTHRHSKNDRTIEMADLFKYFGDPHRLTIMRILSKEELSVSALAEKLNHSISAVSHQLKQLRQARLVSKRRDGKMIYYSLHDDHVKQLILIAQEHVNEMDI